MSEQLLANAAHNNAVWHEAVCRTHGAAGEFRPAEWVTFKEPPPYYGNCVTLSPDAVEDQLGAARELLDARPAGGIGFKDSFDRLDLSQLGYRVLFKASWIARAPAFPGAHNTRPEPSDKSTSVEVVRDAPALRAWEQGWGETPAARMTPIFRPPLLDDPDVAFLSTIRQGKIVGGLIANRTRDVVGVSNIFLPASGGQPVRRSLLDHVALRFPGLTLVGYERGDDLAAMRALGFEETGPLTVWMRDGR